MKKIVHIITTLVIAFSINTWGTAQELKCSVTINSEQIQGSNKQVYETLKTSIEEYINQNRWTNLNYSEQEKIDCSMLIVVNMVEDNLYQCSMTLQSRRPVYGSSYMTPVLNLQDGNFHFSYQEYDRLDWQQNTFTTNLTAMLAYYCYLIIGADQDTYERLGGTPYFTICEDIVSTCQSASMDNKENKGWKAFDSNKNRYALTSNLRDEAFKPYREYVYEYHRLGLDRMSDNAANGRAKIAEGIDVLKTCMHARPAAYIVNTFLDAKADEMVDIFKRGTDGEKKKVTELLNSIDPTREGTWEKITASR